MLKEEMEILNKVEKTERFISEIDLDEKRNRTLLYGYTCDRETWHVYLQDGIIHAVAYGGYNETNKQEIEIYINNDYVPNKRLYAECCDYEFCRLLKECGVNLPFTTYNDDKEETQYYGEIL